AVAERFGRRCRRIVLRLEERLVLRRHIDTAEVRHLHFRLTRFARLLKGDQSKCSGAGHGTAGERGNSPVHRSTRSLSTNDMWGGRFAAGPDAVMATINVSIGFDRRMAKQDLEGSVAHVRMLSAKGIISSAD